MAVTVSDWAWLPRNLVYLIADNLAEFPYIIRFTSVCKLWRSIVLSHQSQRFLPMLITHCSDNKRKILCRTTDKSVYRIQMPLTCDRRFCGSSQGWLFMVDKSLNIRIVNPFLNKTLLLPKFKGVRFHKSDWAQLKSKDESNRLDYFIKKAILLPHNQGGDNFEVLVIYSGMRRLAYLKSWNARWISIKVKATQMFSDIICYKGEVFAINYSSDLVRVDVKTGTYEILIKDATNLFADNKTGTYELLIKGATNLFPDSTYLVESQDGDLLLVRRVNVKSSWHITKGFKVYKLSWEQEGKPKWVKIESIGEQALFLGVNDNLSVSTRDFPQYKSNSIYYVDDYNELWTQYMQLSDDDSGIYYGEYNSFQDPSSRPKLPSIWFVPKLTEYNELPSV